MKTPFKSGPGGFSTMMAGLEDYLGSSSSDQAWLAAQDFGQNDWMLL